MAAQEWPKTLKLDKRAAAEFEQVKAIVIEVRSLVRALGLSHARLYYTDVPFLAANADLIAQMARLDGVLEVSDGSGLHLVTTTYRCWLDVDPTTATSHLKKLTEQTSEHEARLDQLKSRLDNPGYLKSAPEEVVAETREQLAETEASLARLRNEQSRFSELNQ